MVKTEWNDIRFQYNRVDQIFENGFTVVPIGFIIAFPNLYRSLVLILFRLKEVKEVDVNVKNSLATRIRLTIDRKYYAISPQRQQQRQNLSKKKRPRSPT
jgi:hypothetical protein